MSNATPPAANQSLSRRAQLTIVAIVALLAAIGVFGVRLVVAPLANQSEGAARQTQLGSFRPTREQWAGIKVATVQAMTFRPERVTEGNIAIDDDLTTPVFSPYSGRVIRLIAKLGDHVERGAPLLAVEATEFVQAPERSDHRRRDPEDRALAAQPGDTNEKRQHELYLAKGGGAQGLAAEPGRSRRPRRTTCAAHEIALAAVRNRLRILGKSDPEIAALENAADADGSSRSPIVAAPIGGTVTQRQVGLGQNINSASSRAPSNPVYTIGDLSTVWLVANVREADAPLIRVGEPVEVRVLAYPDRVFKAKISWVAPSIDANTHRLPVRADVENPDGALKPVMFASFSIITGADRDGPGGAARARSSTRATRRASGSCATTARSPRAQIRDRPSQRRHGRGAGRACRRGKDRDRGHPVHRPRRQRRLIG